MGILVGIHVFNGNIVKDLLLIILVRIYVSGNIGRYPC